MSTPNYTPFQTINVCTNTLRNVKYFIQLTGPDKKAIYPILIGSGGKMPRVWITNPRGEEIISDNTSKIPTITFNTEGDDTLLHIKVGTQLVFMGKVFNDECVVTHLDLTLFGYNIIGDSSNGLKMGGMSLSGNVFEGSDVAIVM